MGSRPARRSAAHEEAVARRLELLGAELAGFRSDDEPTHTRVRPGRVPPPVVVPVVPVPGRHASRGRLTLGPAQLVVVAGLVLVALVAGGWWLLGGRSAEVAVPPAATAPTSELVSLGDRRRRRRRPARPGW